MANDNLLDWNSISKSGVYSGVNAKNSPADSNGAWVNAIVVQTNAQKNFLAVIAFDCGSNKIWLRNMINGNWLEWYSH